MAIVRGRGGRTRWVAAALAAALTLTACQPNRFVSGWVPYWGGTDGRATLDNNDVATLLTDVSMIWYGTATNGTITTLGSNTSLNSTIASARAQGLPVIPTIFDTSAAGVMRGILDNPVTRTAHVQNIVNLVTTKGFDGIDLDYEVFAFGDASSTWASITPDWVAFLDELSTALHARGKLLSVTVPPVWKSGATTRGYTVYAQQQIAPFVDRLRLMVYDWSISAPGPIAPMWWVNAVIAYSSAIVPVSKLQLGVPTYGRHWATQKNSNETCPDGAVWRESVQMSESAALAAAHSRTPTRAPDGELTYGWTQVVTGPRTKPLVPPVWTPPATVATQVTTPAANAGLQPALRLSPPSTPVTCTVQHTVFVPDAGSVRQRADAALAAGWSGIALFAFGYETTDIYQSLAGIAPQRPGGAPTGSLAAPAVTGGSVRVTGQAWHPEFDLPLAVRLTVTRTGGGITVHTVSARAQIAGSPAGLGPFHGIDDTFTLAPGSYTVCGEVLGWGGAVIATTNCQPFSVTGPL